MASRHHHLLKTFWAGPHGWRDEQLPDGTVIWTDPDGGTHTTRPGSYRLFPKLCQPTAPVVVRVTTSTPDPGSALAMPRRKRTRTQDRAARVQAERRKNENDVAQGQLGDTAVGVRDGPPPF